MADDVIVSNALNADNPDYTAATDEVGGVHYQKVKIDVGADGASSPLVRGAQTSANSLPVVIASDQAAIPVTVGSLNVTVDNASLEIANDVGNPVPVSITGTPIVTLRDSLGTDIKAGGGTETQAMRVTIASNSTGVVGVHDNGASLTVDGTVAISSSALPTGASTSAKQPALGTAGSASSDVITVQGIASMTALKVDGSAVTQPISAAGNLTVVQGTATNLKTQAEAYQGGSAVAAGNPLQVTLANGSVPSHAVTNAGTFATQDSQVIVDNAGFTDGTSKVFPVGYIYDEVAGTALTENDAAAARINANRAQVQTIEDGATRGRYATVTASNALKVDASGVAVPVTDNSGSLTVDAPVGTPVFVRLSDGSSAIATLPVSLASVPSHAVTNAGTFATQDSQVIADNAAFTDGTSKVFPVGYIYDEVAGTALTENDTAAARINVNRAQIHAIEDGVTRGRYATVSAANALKVDNSGVTQPVSNAGTFVTQENGAALTAMQLLDDVVVADNAGFTDGTTKLSMSGYIYDEVAGTALTENDAAAGRINVNRAQVHAIEDGVTRGRYATVSASNALKVDGSAVTQPVSGTVSITTNSAVNVAQMNGVTVTMGNGVAGTGVQRVTLASDSTGQVALATGSNAIGKLTANSGVDIGDVTLNNDLGNGVVSANTLRVTKAQEQTYSAMARDITPAASATDVITITGSASKTVKIRKIFLTATQTTGGFQFVNIKKRSTANSAGTSAALTAVPLDSNNNAATATCLSYTANPTLGTAVGDLLVVRTTVPGVTAADYINPLLWSCGDNGAPIVLRGTAQVLAIHLNGATITGGSITGGFEWTEE